jgi:hypothetical protein
MNMLCFIKISLHCPSFPQFTKYSGKLQCEEDLATTGYATGSRSVLILTLQPASCMLLIKTLILSSSPRNHEKSNLPSGLYQRTEQEVRGEWKSSHKQSTINLIHEH